MSLVRAGKVHINYGGGAICGAGRRWGSQDITSVRSFMSSKVTCISCVRIAWAGDHARPVADEIIARIRKCSR